MARTISIRSLIRERPSSDAAGTGQARLPDCLQDSLPLWSVLAQRAGEVLSPLLGCDVTVRSHLSATTHEELRRSAEKPGLFLPLEPLTSGAMFRFPGETAIDLSAFLLRAADSTLTKPEMPDGLDDVLTREVAIALAGLVEDAFGLRLRLAAEGEGETSWPLTPPPGGTKLLATFTIEPEGGEAREVQLVFPTLEEAHFAKILDRSDRGIDLSGVTLPVTVVLSRWTADAVTIAGLAPGNVISIPGGDLGRVMLEADGADCAKDIAIGALGTERGRHSVKVLSTL
ncbi:hypothetical protein [Parvularcula lutaonensis]|uniref:Flagellar motor switch protein FliN-like C-terminal domain-containing protein n=1 Tax=Parvularcula lutaonensis TaxID=491923 RepID=A0ABV7M846_9PROT|nr:hypothetical protein [Parvularcula lutaonensis]GGY43827.1 hypothetical protein GCM10007148_10790 [Parvularcula lutaonensis]